MSPVPETDRAGLERIVAQLEAAWNAMDGPAFAARFAFDADFVTIRGEHFRERPAIAAGHSAIFRTNYAGSTNRLTVENARLLRAAYRASVLALTNVPGLGTRLAVIGSAEFIP